MRTNTRLLPLMACAKASPFPATVEVSRLDRPAFSRCRGKQLRASSPRLPLFQQALTGLLASLSLGLCQAQRLSISPDHTNGVYQVGETVHWRVSWSGESKAPLARYKFLSGGLVEAGQGELSLSNGAASLETRFGQPGTMLAEVIWKSEGGPESRALGGAVAGAGAITLAAPPPADFDSFWKSKLEELAAVPPAPVLEAAEGGRTNVSYWKITMNNIRGSHIQGQIARPAAGAKLPALLQVQYAGVYGLPKNWVTDRAAEGWLTLNIEAHDLPIDRPEAFYQEQFNGPLKNYWAIGNDDRDQSYFLRMYLSCYRAVEYLSQRPDWDGKVLVVMGGSQGGLQALMTAGMHPKVTAALASVPAGCDVLGPRAGRRPGWPQWFDIVWGKDAAKVREAARYYDVANFTPRIKCPVLIGLGLIDETCPPAGILAAANQITAPKEVLILPLAGHQDEHNTHEAYNRRCYGEWLPALRQGKPAPVREGFQY